MSPSKICSSTRTRHCSLSPKFRSHCRARYSSKDYWLCWITTSWTSWSLPSIQPTTAKGLYSNLLSTIRSIWHMLDLQQPTIPSWRDAATYTTWFPISCRSTSGANTMASTCPPSTTSWSASYLEKMTHFQQFWMPMSLWNSSFRSARTELIIGWKRSTGSCPAPSSANITNSWSGSKSQGYPMSWAKSGSCSSWGTMYHTAPKLPLRLCPAYKDWCFQEISGSSLRSHGSWSSTIRAKYSTTRLNYPRLLTAGMQQALIGVVVQAQ